MAVLLNHARPLVTRDQLRSEIWPQDTFVDFDHALNTAMTKSGHFHAEEYFLGGTKNETATLEFFDLATRKRTLIGDVDKPRPGLAVSPDGRFLLYSRGEFEDYEIMLVKNFH